MGGLGGDEVFIWRIRTEMRVYRAIWREGCRCLKVRLGKEDGFMG